MIKTMDLGGVLPDELVDRLVDYCIKTWGSREGAIRALAAVGVGAEQCTAAAPHAAHLQDGCPGLSLREWIAGEGEQPLTASAGPDEAELDEAEYLRELNQDAAEQAAEFDTP